MAHYAFLDENNMVVQVIAGRDEDEVIDGISDWEAYYSEVTGLVCKRTSYNAINGKRRNPETGEITDEPAFRGNYGCVGYYYDEELDVFIPPKSFPSWIYDPETFSWKPPLDYPSDGKPYIWSEEAVQWREVEIRG